ncbi:MAG: HAMP domain-containing histidine kinase [Actinomycetota bacterium]|nr:HAMP domain-containing histidine kinase [Actinomycetota bacterium]
MTRRILSAQVALLVAVLLGAIIPLGLATTADDRAAFRGATLGTARSVGTVAEEKLDDKRSDPQLAVLLSRIVGAGDAVEVVRRDGSMLARAGRPVAAPQLLAAALRGHPATGWSGRGDSRHLGVAVPVGGQSPPVGAVLLIRPAEPLDRTIHRLWLLLIGVATAAALAAAAVALALARWVGRPVRSLEATARSFGDARLEARAAADFGPPEIRQLATTFNAMAARLETVVHGHRAAIADVSHQLRTPLAAIRLRLELLADESAGSPTAAEAGAALAEVARLSRLVDGMLAIARGENTDPRPDDVPVGKIAVERVDAWRPVADEAAIALRSEVSAGDLTAAMTSGHLEQVLDNLLDNAITASPPGGTVAVHAGRHDGLVRLMVIDDGPGMTPQQQAGAFHRFSGDAIGGSGLGLAIVHRLITSDGGRISIATAPSGGLAVTVLLMPAGPVRAAGPAHPGAAPVAERSRVRR